MIPRSKGPNKDHRRDDGNEDEKDPQTEHFFIGRRKVELMRKQILLALPFSFFVFFASLGAQASTNWWNDSIIYEIFVRSFQDSNGDGIGDLRGITQRLDYINSGKHGDPQSLGADAIWLTPIFASPSYHGYDAIDFKKVNPDFGTMDDFKELVSESHKRGIKVILDLAVNHTSNQNPWFLQSKTSKTSPYHDWYLWKDQDPGWTGNLGHWWPLNQEFYYASFSKGLPDLNWLNPDVMTQVKDVLHFWSQAGVDGFRLDAARYYVKGPRGQADTAGTHQVLQTFIQDLKRDYPQAFFVGEIWAEAGIISSYVNNGRELDAAFNFPVSFGLQNSLVAENAAAFKKAMSDTLRLVKNQGNVQGTASGTLAPFLTNHDMIRIASVVNAANKNNAGKLSLAAAALFSLPGTPVIYYGEEIGMANTTPISSNDLDKRTPMQWESSKTFGFTTNLKGPWHAFSNSNQDKNVQTEQADSSSLLSSYQSLIRLRKSQPTLMEGDTFSLNTDNSQVAVFARRTKQETIFIALNFSPKPINKVNFTMDLQLLPGSNPQIASLWGKTNAQLQMKKGSPSVSLDVLPALSAAIIKFSE